MKNKVNNFQEAERVLSSPTTGGNTSIKMEGSISRKVPSAKLTNQHRVVDGLEENNTPSRSNDRHSCESGVVGAEQADE